MFMVMFALCCMMGKAHRWGTFPIPKALPGFFLCIFSSITCLKKPVLSKRDLTAVEGTSEAVLGSSGQ
jgi:hypothetical protein